MTCPVCGRLYCDHSPIERGQTLEQMLKDMYSPHIIDEEGKTKRVTEEEYEKCTGRKYRVYKKEENKK
mgnify:FL=1